MMKRGLVWAVCAALAMTGVGMLTPIAQAAEVNVIPDAGLRQCLAETMHESGTGYSPGTPEFAIEAQSISQADLDSLALATTWDYGLECTGVGSLSGLQNLHDSDLYYLRLDNSTVTDFSVLASMPNIYNLHVNNTPITVIPASIPKLTSITQLEFNHTQISDLTPLKDMTWLTDLWLGSNQISDVTPLKNLTKLEQLYLWGNHITDLSPLAKIPVPENLNGDWQMSGETLTSSARTGSAVPLPSVTNVTWDDPVEWAVVKGDASIDGSKGTVTYNSPGNVILQWHGANKYAAGEADNAESCVASGGVWIGQDDETPWIVVGPGFAAGSAGGMPCAWYVFSGTMTVTTCQDFTDVPSSNTFAPAICWVSATGITKGTGNGSTYSPSNPVNRGSMAAFLYRLAGSPKWDPPKISPFVDVKTTDTFYPAITWLYSQGVTVGTTVNGKVYYQPSNAVNRGSMSAFLYRFSASPKWTLPTTSPFADVAQTNTFYKSITWLADQKITVGSTSGGKLVYQPGNPVNRGSMAAFMQRLAKTELQCTRYGNAIGC